MKSGRAKTGVAILGLMTLMACIAALALILQKERDEMPRETEGDCGFDVVPEHAAMKAPCSPKHDELDFDFRGVKINVPARAQILDDGEGMGRVVEARVPVYLLLQLPVERLMKYRFEREGIALFFVRPMRSMRLSKRTGPRQ